MRSNYRITEPPAVNHHLHRPRTSPRCKLQLLFLDQLKFLNEFRRTRNVIVDAQDFRLRSTNSSSFDLVTSVCIIYKLN